MQMNGEESRTDWIGECRGNESSGSNRECEREIIWEFEFILGA